jgi:hypothetical protein
MATLLTWLACGGSRLPDGTPNASGTVSAFVPGTSTFATVYGDAAESAPLTQPVPLDQAGRATVYVRAAVDLQFEDSSGAMLSVNAAAGGTSAPNVEIENQGFTGVGPTGTLVAGGKTSLDAILTSAFLSFGGTDFQYLESPGGTPLPIQTVIRDIAVDVRSFGAKGDGSADDTTAIQTGLNRILALGGGVLFFPPGTYNISSTLVLGAVQGLVIRGSGQRVTKIVQTNSSQGGITIGTAGAASNDVNMYDIQFIANSNLSPVGVSLIRVNRSLLSNVFISQFATGASYTSSCTNILIANNSTIIGAASGLGVSVTSASTMAINNSLVSAAFGTAVSLTSVVNSVFTGSFFGNSTNGIAAATCSGGLEVFGCSFAGATTPFSFTGADPGFTQSGNSIDGYTETVASGGSVTPDWTRGYSIRYEGLTTGAPYNVNAPTVAPPTRKGVVMKLELYNHAGGALTGVGWTFAAIFHRSATAVSTVDTHHTTLTFEYDIVLNVWREIGISDTT